MKLFLTANGISNSALEEEFLKMTHNKKNLRVGLIPTAGDSIEWVPDIMDSGKFTVKLLKQNNAKLGESYLNYKKKGYDVIVVDLQEDPKEIKEKLRSVDILDVGGGDVNYLLNWAKKSKLNTYLKDMLASGVMYVGTSAGSMLLNPDIGFTWWEPDWKSDHVGLGITEFIFQPLHGETDELTTQKLISRKKYLQSIIDYPWKIYLVKDAQAIKVDGDEMEHIGIGIKESI